MKWKVISFFVLFLAGAGVFGVALADKIDVRKEKLVKTAEEGVARAEAASIVRPPDLVKPVAAQAQDTLTFTGTLEAESSVEVAFKVSGRVTAVNYRRGDVVEASKEMAALELPEIAVQDAQAKAALKVAKAQQHAAADILRRSKKLTTAGVGTEQQLEMAAGQESVSKAAISQAIAAGKAVEVMKSETTIVAPMGGTVTMAPTSNGFLAAPGVPLFRIDNLATLRFRGHLAEREAVRLKKGLLVDVRSEAGRTAKGEVSLILGSFEPGTHRVPIEALVDNSKGELFAGSLVDATVAIEPISVFTLPMTTLLTGDQPAVLAVGKNDVLEKRELDVLETRDGKMFIRSGVAATDRVVDNPGTAWRPGAVLPKPAANAAVSKAD
ncbi:MAG: efflux RND transporter periplasmic adaptor subunit [Myxococcales bacterium]|nr:efflux RND transporter periplasmic adaptor subunit [Myxococcales bacterium]